MSAVLLVDDEPFVLKAFVRLLRRLRPAWRVVAVGSAEEALAELARADYEAVVSDMRMPEMDGAELLERVREQHPATRRIILTGYAERAVTDRALAVVHELLMKPCDVQALIDEIERAQESPVGAT